MTVSTLLCGSNGDELLRRRADPSISTHVNRLSRRSSSASHQFPLNTLCTYLVVQILAFHLRDACQVAFRDSILPPFGLIPRTCCALSWLHRKLTPALRKEEEFDLRGWQVLPNHAPSMTVTTAAHRCSSRFRLGAASRTFENPLVLVVSISLFLPETRAVPLAVTTFFSLIPWHSIIFPLRKSTVVSSHPQRGRLSHTDGQTEHAATVSAGSILTLGPGGDEGQACGSLQDLAHRLRLSIVRFRTTVPSRSDTTAGTRRLLIQTSAAASTSYSALASRLPDDTVLHPWILKMVLWSSTSRYGRSPPSRPWFYNCPVLICKDPP